MKVYIVTGYDLCGSDIHGVYANKEDAEKKRDEINWDYRCDATYRSYVEEYEVIEHESN